MTRYLPFYRYKKHLGLDVNIKNASTCEVEAVVLRSNTFPCLCGGRKCIRFHPPRFVGGSKTFDLGGARE